jgi:hypothetical protein
LYDISLKLNGVGFFQWWKNPRSNAMIFSTRISSNLTEVPIMARLTDLVNADITAISDICGYEITRCQPISGGDEKYKYRSSISVSDRR